MFSLKSYVFVPLKFASQTRFSGGQSIVPSKSFHRLLTARTDRQLLDIFIEVDDEWDDDDEIDIEKIAELVGKGASINARGKISISHLFS